MHVESFLVACLDEGSSPSVSTKKSPKFRVILEFGVFYLGEKGEGGGLRFKVQSLKFKVQGLRFKV